MLEREGDLGDEKMMRNDAFCSGLDESRGALDREMKQSAAG